MNGGVSKLRTRRSRVKLSKAWQDALLDAVTSNTAGTELPPSRREPSPESADPAGDTTPAQARKRPLGATTESNTAPAKRARLTQTDAQQPGVEGEKVEPADENHLRQPKPSPPSRPYASFLKDFVDPVHPSPRPASVHTFVSEWLESIGSDRDKHCRSDSCLHHSDLVPRRLTRSAPEMGHTKDAGGFAVPPTPPSTGSRSRRPSAADNYSQFSAASASGSSSGVRNRMYRQNNLALSNIYVRPSAAPLPDVVSSHVETIRAERDSPGLSSNEMKQVVGQLDVLAEGCDEDDVAAFLSDTIFPNPKTDPVYGPATGLMSSSSTLMSQHLVPTNPISPYNVTQPKPDKLYGYSGNPNAVFTQQQMLAQATLHPHIPHYPAATSQGLRLPFFAIEFKAAGGTRGDLWVATNQCAGASSACLSAVNQLNTSLREYQSKQRVDNLSYCIAVDNNTAQLYISWKEDDLNYYLQRVDAFLLSRPEDFKNFRKQVRNILDWGKDARLKQIRDALDTILEENRKRASEAAKSRPPPSYGSGGSSSKKHKSSSSRRNSSRSNSALGQSGETNELYWEVDDTATQEDWKQSSSYQQQSFIQDVNDGPASEHHCQDRPEQIQTPASFDAAEPLASFTDPLASFATDPAIDDGSALPECNPEDDQQDYENLDGTTYQPTHPRSSKHNGQQKAKQRRTESASNSAAKGRKSSSHSKAKAKEGQNDGW